MMRIPVNKPSITELEIAYVTDAITNGWGDHCYDYVNRFTETLKSCFGVKYAWYAWPTSSCHGALHTVLMALYSFINNDLIKPYVNIGLPIPNRNPSLRGELRVTGDRIVSLPIDRSPAGSPGLLMRRLHREFSQLYPRILDMM